MQDHTGVEEERNKGVRGRRGSNVETKLHSG